MVVSSVVTLAVDWMDRRGCGMLSFEHILGANGWSICILLFIELWLLSSALEDDTRFQDMSRENHASLTFCPTVVHDVGLAE